MIVDPPVSDLPIKKASRPEIVVGSVTIRLEEGASVGRNLNPENIWSLSRTTPMACSPTSAGPRTAGSHIARAAAAWSRTASDRRLRCSEPVCRAEFLVTSGSVVANRKLSFKKTIMAIWEEITAA
ncbi:hypothetical protein NXC12_PD00260 (plasmid) [Rhizobium etli]|uniref:Uncharacterized protein n=1 Tax=Rhizobium etli TaxID=29449 RepID=A0AAN1BLA8_RHIET|nr:hypothetical protein [Rhizobium etli]ARQ13354.1 hypothetical protein NXC12_PD00260 [Rhizobium etli]